VAVAPTRSRATGRATRTRLQGVPPRRDSGTVDTGAGDRRNARLVRVLSAAALLRLVTHACGRRRVLCDAAGSRVGGDHRRRSGSGPTCEGDATGDGRAAPRRTQILELLRSESGQLFIPAPVTAEVDYSLGSALVRRRGGPSSKTWLRGASRPDPRSGRLRDRTRARSSLYRPELGSRRYFRGRHRAEAADAPDRDLR
jgi:hypothetical protein